jgi:multiple sugar transport system substrate-binding protein
MLKKLTMMCLVIIVASSVGARSAEKVTLKWYTGTTVEFLTTSYQKLVEKYNKSHPNVDLTMISTIGSRDLVLGMLAVLRTDKGPDVISANGLLSQAALKYDLVYDLEPLIKKDRLDFRKDYIGVPMSEWEKNGHSYYLPMSGMVDLFMYDRKAFKDRGLVDPAKLYKQGDWSWDYFRNLLLKLTRDADGDGKPDFYGMAFPMLDLYEGVIPAYFLFKSWIVANGGEFISADRSRVPYDTPQVVEVLEFMRKLFVDDNVVGYAGGVLENEKGFFDGKFGLWWALPSYDRWVSGAAPKLDWGWAHVPSPKRGAKPVYLHWNIGLVIARASKHPGESWEFIKWLSRDEAQEFLGANRIPPLLKKAFLNNRGYMRDDRKRGYEVVREAFEMSRSRVWTLNDTYVDGAMNQVIEKLFSGQITAQDAGRQIAENGRQVLEELNRRFP